MMVFAGLLACLTLWWLSRNGGLGRRIRRGFGQGLGAFLGRARLPTLGAFALLAAGFLLLRGNLVLAALLGLGGVWLIEGQAAMTARVSRLVRRKPIATDRLRTTLIEATLGLDGSLRAGRVRAGPSAGASLDDLPVDALIALLRLCRQRDAAGAILLEPYLDRRAPGWRVDAQRDRDPRPGRPPHPGAMTEEEAHQILGLQRGATAEQIRAAHRSLMKRAHPDQGGSAEGAARVNAARDRLVNRHR